jgi:hypothetical protein
MRSGYRREGLREAGVDWHRRLGTRVGYGRAILDGRALGRASWWIRSTDAEREGGQH